MTCVHGQVSEKSIISAKHDRGINSVPRNWNGHMHMDSQFGVFFKIDQSVHVFET